MAYSRRQGKNGWSLFLLILAGIVIGGLIGDLAANVPFLSWLRMGYSFGFESPIHLDLKIMTLMLQVEFDITISSILGIGLAIFTYTRI